MPKIWLPDGGVNRQVKKISFADLSGVQRVAKTGWANVGDGVNRKVFSAGIPATLGGSYQKWSTTGVSGASSNDFVGGNWVFGGSVSNDSSKDTKFAYVGGRIIITKAEGFPPGQPSVTPRLRINTVTVDLSETAYRSNDGITLQLILTDESGVNIVAQLGVSIAINPFAGAQTFTYTDLIMKQGQYSYNSSGPFILTAYISSNWNKKDSGGNLRMFATIPANSLVWLPTGETIYY